jgi:hypothetical protein
VAGGSGHSSQSRWQAAPEAAVIPEAHSVPKCNNLYSNYSTCILEHPGDCLVCVFMYVYVCVTLSYVTRNVMHTSLEQEGPRWCSQTPVTPHLTQTPPVTLRNPSALFDTSDLDDAQDPVSQDTYWLAFCLLDTKQTRVSGGRENLSGEKRPQQFGLWVILWSFSQFMIYGHTTLSRCPGLYKTQAGREREPWRASQEAAFLHSLWDSLNSCQGVAQGYLSVVLCVSAIAEWLRLWARQVFTMSGGRAALLALKVYGSYNVEATEKVDFLVQSRLPQCHLCHIMELRTVMGPCTRWGPSSWKGYLHKGGCSASPPAS